MDFRPTRNTLIANYLVTFGILGVLVFLSLRNPTTYYYSPEYTTHTGYGLDAAQSCRQCHIQAFASFEEKTCWTSGCHTNFEPDGKLATKQMLSMTKSESSGETRENYGALLGFHKALPTAMACATCHPSHQLPQTGKFNEATLVTDLKKKLATSPPKDPSPAGLKAVRAEVFHEKAEQFTGKVSCQTCHVNVNQLAAHFSSK